MLPLGFSSGLPFLLVFSTLSTWLREAGISLTIIGLMSWVGLAYSFKFLWAPIVDRYDVPVLARLLGRRRGWMALAQLGVMAGLIGMIRSGEIPAGSRVLYAHLGGQPALSAYAHTPGLGG